MYLYGDGVANTTAPGTWAGIVSLLDVVGNTRCFGRVYTYTRCLVNVLGHTR